MRRLVTWLARLFRAKAVACGRCGSPSARACTRIDCPRHEAEAGMGPLSALE